MDLYTAECWPLDRHHDVILAAERNARLVPDLGRGRFGVWLAAGLRGLADRLDSRVDDVARPAIVRSIRRPAP